MNRAVGYQNARALMRELDWKLTVHLGAGAPLVCLYHPKQPTVYRLRDDAYLKLRKELRPCGSKNSSTVYCYDWEHSNPENI